MLGTYFLALTALDALDSLLLPVTADEPALLVFCGIQVIELCINIRGCEGAGDPDIFRTYFGTVVAGGAGDERDAAEDCAGLFDDPYRYLDKKRASKEIYTADNRAEARRIAAETFVLLKNDDGLLPLQKIIAIGECSGIANRSWHGSRKKQG